MDAIEAIKTRQSVRVFRREPVDQAILEEIVETARWSPSYKNSQPWQVVIVSGERKKALSKLMLDLFEQGAAPSPDLPTPTHWPPMEQANIDRLYAMRKEAMGLDLDDPEVIRKAKKANFQFYHAPHAIYLHQDDSLTEWSLLDIGMFAQSLMLAAHARGLGTVPQAFVTDYARQVKEFLDIPPTHRLVLGLSVGYPDEEALARGMRTERAPLADILRVVS